MQTTLESEAELIGEKIRAAVPKMTKEQRYYLLGFGEALAGKYEEELEEKQDAEKAEAAAV